MTAVAVVIPPTVAAIHCRGVEVWDRSANRVIDACKQYGAAPPIFTEQQGFVVVTFKAEIVAGSLAQPGSRPESGRQVGTQSKKLLGFQAKVQLEQGLPRTIEWQVGVMRKLK